MRILIGALLIAIPSLAMYGILSLGIPLLIKLPVAAIVGYTVIAAVGKNLDH